MKFRSGLMICYYSTYQTTTTGSTYGDTTWTFPAAFLELPTVVVSNTRPSTNYNLLVARVNNITKTSAQYVWRDTTANTDAKGVVLNNFMITAIGRWK